eukprot:CAMPEP_0204249932 /NCGR_PEP_ID=MMETSP0361-20130328/99912_1 /ASSEMBLY_ACC=CAM_ASM_000343 /TAXON_ID=268821 /ORGANISM="Scrippsiella Hangoei, Strain SHTV-5" /LENGTH=173 /DNA_ID=CAMNT_0051223201 /DNA_START=913 /DNA_END=1434 /DNA_ORIENTATION=-
MGKPSLTNKLTHVTGKLRIKIRYDKHCSELGGAALVKRGRNLLLFRFCLLVGNRAPGLFAPGICRRCLTDADRLDFRSFAFSRIRDLLLLVRRHPVDRLPAQEYHEHDDDGAEDCAGDAWSKVELRHVLVAAKRYIEILRAFQGEEVTGRGAERPGQDIGGPKKKPARGSPAT